MTKKDRLQGKKILIVDDEPDVLSSLEDILSMCTVVKAASFQEAEKLLEEEYFDFAILDIMGVDGYALLAVANKKGVMAVMLTAYAVTPQDIKLSYQEGAASFVPKEKLADIPIFLADILEGREKGKSLWWRWFDRLADYCERKFGPDWQEKHGFKVK